MPYLDVPNVVLRVSNTICIIGIIINMIHIAALLSKPSPKHSKSENFITFLLVLAFCETVMAAGWLILDHKSVQLFLYRHHWTCVLNATIIHSLFVFETVLLSILSMERIMAVCFPYKYDRLVTKRLVIRVLLSAYGVVLMVYVSLAAVFHDRAYSVKGSGVCTLSSTEIPKLIMVTIASTLFNLAVITISSIGLILKTYRLVQNHPSLACASALRTAKQHKLMTITMTVLVASKIVCWLPIIIATAMRRTTEDTTMEYIGRVMIQVFPIVSPLVYGISNKQYRIYVLNKISCATKINPNTGDIATNTQTNGNNNDIDNTIGNENLRPRLFTTTLEPRDP